MKSKKTSSKIKALFSRRHLGQSVFVIAEVGSNHDQSLSRAVDLIHAAALAGADAVKFQSLEFDYLYPPTAPENIRKLYDRIKLDPAWYPTLFETARTCGLVPMSCPTYFLSIEYLKNQEIECFKIASPQTYAFPQLLDQVASLKVPTVISTGYCDDRRIQRAVNIFRRHRCPFVLLHCRSQYPLPPNHVGLLRMVELQKRFSVPVGYSDHTEGAEIALAAVALGAVVIEKHITYDRNAAGPDHPFAMDVRDFKEMVRQIRNVEKALSSKAIITAEEKALGKSMRMAAFSARALRTQERLTADNVSFLRSSEGISAEDLFDSTAHFEMRKAISAQTLIKAEMTKKS